MRLRTIGFPVVKPAAVLGEESYMHELIAGITRVLIPRGDSLLVRVVPSRGDVAKAVSTWAAEASADAVVLIDLVPGDPVVELVKTLALPAVVCGDPDASGGLPTVWSQDEVAMRAAVEALVDAGHRRLGHVTGPASMAHTIVRSHTFDECVTAAGADGSRAEGDYSQQSGALAARALLGATARPTALIVDNDLMALGVLEAAARLGLLVPHDLSVVAWDDSDLCRLSNPPLTALTHDIQGVGELIGRMVLDVLDGARPSVARPAAAELISRGSTAAILAG